MSWIEEENRKNILHCLSKTNLRFQELLGKVEVSRATLSKHLKQLEGKKAIEKIYDTKKRGVVYKISEKTLIEELIIEALTQHIGKFTTVNLLEANARGEKSLKIEEFYNVQDFINSFIEEMFNKKDIDPKTLLDSFKKKYGEVEV